jgi:hypothetical protein
MRKKSDLLKDLSRIIESADIPGATPAEKPDEVFAQVRPLLTKMGLINMTDRTKTAIIQGQVQKKNSLYQIVLRRNAQITKDTIDRIKRNEENLNVIQWSARAIEVQVWWPFNPTPNAAPAPEQPQPVPQTAPPTPPQ